MPNSLDREAFEAAYRKIYPATYPTITPNAFERDHDGYYIRTPIQEAWAWWQAGAAAAFQDGYQAAFEDAVKLERAACIKICEEHASDHWDHEGGALACADRIRDRSAP